MNLSKSELARLTLAIKAAHKAARRSAEEMLTYAIEIGKLLLEAKSRLGSDQQWGDWVEQRLPFGLRQAQRYTRVAKNEQALRDATSSKSLLHTADGTSLEELLGLIVTPRGEAEEKADDRRQEAADAAQEKTAAKQRQKRQERRERLSQEERAQEEAAARRRYQEQHRATGEAFRTAYESMFGDRNRAASSLPDGALDDVHRALERMSKILGMLGSEHDAEVIEAARQADALRRKLGLNWRDILAVPLKRRAAA